MAKISKKNIINKLHNNRLIINNLEKIIYKDNLILHYY